MNSGIANLEAAYYFVFVVALIFLACMIFLCLIRAIISPKVTDRIISINMIGTMILVMISVLALMQNEGYLVDICIIYAMISFLSVVVLCKVYMGVYIERQEKQKKEEHDLENINHV